MYGCLGGQAGGWVGGCMYVWMGGWTDGRIDGQIIVYHFFIYICLLPIVFDYSRHQRAARLGRSSKWTWHSWTHFLNHWQSVTCRWKVQAFRCRLNIHKSKFAFVYYRGIVEEAYLVIVLGYFFLISPYKHMLRVLAETLLMSIYNICFCGELEKIISQLSPNTPS